MDNKAPYKFELERNGKAGRAKLEKKKLPSPFLIIERVGVLRIKSSLTNEQIIKGNNLSMA